ncbi:MAG TPA: hypothetical protein VM221_05450 [Armatimonadota bacterium]|nr:hypothetical protein [Armatimonadota bacterium]
MRKLAVTMVVALAAAAAHAELLLDPASIPGVGAFQQVRAVVAADAAVMAWRSGAPSDVGQILAAYSTDGEHWGSPVQVSGAYPEWVVSDDGASEFTLARASSGTYWLAWSATTGWLAEVSPGRGSADAGLSYVARSPDIWISMSEDGRAWSPPGAVALAPTPDRAPGIIEMLDGRMGVIWVSEREGGRALSLTLAVPEHQTVQASPGISGDLQYDLLHAGPLFVADRRGRLTLAWVSDRDGEPQVWAAWSADGQRWSQSVRVSSQPGAKGFVTVEEVAGGYDLYWSALAGEDEQRWVSHSADFAAWSEPQLAPLGK